MTLAAEFLTMAKEMLDDPEVGCDATIEVSVPDPNPVKPWEPTFQTVTTPLRVFYTSAENNMVNGSVVLAGEKVCITYPPDGVGIERVQTAKFIDHNGQHGVVNAVQPITAGNVTVAMYIKVGV